ncbi:MAG: glucose-6-phosphate dehydrogenase, partial [Sphingopyxis sp.]
MAFVSDRLIVFGATGDLAKRMLLPSLAALHADGLVADDLKIIGTARSPHDDASFRAFARAALDEFLPAGQLEEADIARFLERLSYQPLDASQADGFAALAAKVGAVKRGLSIFLSTAP